MEQYQTLIQVLRVKRQIFNPKCEDSVVHTLGASISKYTWCLIIYTYMHRSIPTSPINVHLSLASIVEVVISDIEYNTSEPPVIPKPSSWAPSNDVLTGNHLSHCFQTILGIIHIECHIDWLNSCLQEKSEREGGKGDRNSLRKELQTIRN